MFQVLNLWNGDISFKYVAFQGAILKKIGKANINFVMPAYLAILPHGTT